MLRETLVPVAGIAEAWKLRWKISARDYFDFRIPGAFAPEPTDTPREVKPGCWEIELSPDAGTAVTFELLEQGVGWPFFTVEAPDGTTIELLVHEAHQTGEGRARGRVGVAEHALRFLDQVHLP